MNYVPIEIYSNFEKSIICILIKSQELYEAAKIIKIQTETSCLVGP